MRPLHQAVPHLATAFDPSLLGYSADAALRDAFDQALEGRKLRWADNLAEVVIELGQDRELMLLLDVRAEGTLALLDQLRSSQHFSRRIVIGLSSEDSQLVFEALQAGASDCFSQPFAPSLIQAKLAFFATRARGQGGIRLGAYELLEPLGRGSYGTVYRARHPEFGDSVALKLISDELLADDEARARFQREVQILSSLRLPFLVRFLEAGEAAGRHYLAMEQARGESAQAVLERDGPFTLEAGLRVARGLSSCLAGLRAHGLVHRDVKPANVILSDRGEPILIDLGLAKDLASPGITASTALMGTPIFFAPEVVRGAKESCLSDAYALGITLWTLWTGRVPYHEDTVFDLLRKIATGEPIHPLRSIRKDLPPLVGALVDGLLDPNPTTRTEIEVAAAGFARLLARWEGLYPGQPDTAIVHQLPKGIRPASDLDPDAPTQVLERLGDRLDIAAMRRALSGLDKTTKTERMRRKHG